MAGLKAIVLWFPRERVALINGYMITLGALGAVTATAPAEALLDWMGWRGLFEVLAAASATVAVVIHFVVPERAKRSQTTHSSATLKTVYSDARFWRIAPLSATCVGSAWALQSLWAGPWLRDVEGLDRTNLVTQLSLMAIALSVGALLLGMIADRVRARGEETEKVFVVVAAAFIAGELMLILHPPWSSLLPWCIVSVVGSATALSYAIIADYFPTEVAARANGGLNVLHFAWAFVVQYGTGLVLEHWSPQEGHYPAIAYQFAFSLNVALQMMALAWFTIPWFGAVIRKIGLSAPRSPVGHWSSLAPDIPPVETTILEADENVEW
jgi:predicted MFS family arabinose efflux permease